MSGISQEKRQKFIDLQRKYCREEDLPFSIPDDGFCGKCGYDLVEHFGEHLGKQFVQGCPKCCKRYSAIMVDYSPVL